MPDQSSFRRTAAELTRSDWDSLCRRCGECCFEKWVDERGTVFPTAIACRHLDIVTRDCRVYHKRLHVGEGCIQLTPEIVAAVQWLPAGCGYRLWHRNVNS